MTASGEKSKPLFVVANLFLIGIFVSLPVVLILQQFQIFGRFAIFLPGLPLCFLVAYCFAGGLANLILGKKKKALAILFVGGCFLAVIIRTLILHM